MLNSTVLLIYYKRCLSKDTLTLNNWPWRMFTISRLIKSIRWSMLAGTIAYCQIPTGKHSGKVEQPVVVELNQWAEQLTHKYLLQVTCTLSVNSSCQMITIALVALSEASQKYKNELIKVIDIMENNEFSDDELDYLLIEFRSLIADAKTFYLDTITAMDSALQLGQSSSQMSFTVGADSVLNTMSERLYSAEREFRFCIEETKKVEDKFIKLLADIIKKSNNKNNKIE